MATFPKDKTLPNTDAVIRQTDCQYSFGDDAATFTIKLAGNTNSVVNMAAGFRKGTRIVWSDFKSKFAELSSLNLSGIYTSGKVVSSTTTTKTGSAQAIITVQIPYSNKVASSASDADNPRKYKVVTWSEKSTQYEFPLGIYAGEGESASTINAGEFEAWKNMKTTDIAKYKNFEYELSGSTFTLGQQTMELAKKWYKGIEAVDRAYPEVVRTTNYYNYKGDALSVDNTLINQITETPNLYKIDTTPDAIWTHLFSNFSWVKSAFDVDIQPTEYDKLWNITVTEAWIGIDKEERGEWDENLYGATIPPRWKFADITGQNNN